MEIKRYTNADQLVWDEFIRSSKNGTFLFCRKFMEYHKDRFCDHSLLFFHKTKLLAVLPAHIQDNTFASHLGLTYGGLVMSNDVTSVQVLKIFEYLVIYLKEQDLDTLIYKSIPHIYHKTPAEEDLYALFRLGAKIFQRQVSSTIDHSTTLSYSRFRRNGLKKAAENKLQVLESDNFSCFWSILGQNLLIKYKTSPVHTLGEITYLKNNFPSEIKLYEVRDEKDKVIAGSVTFETETTTHIQYIAGTDEAKQMGAIDMLVHHIIEKSKLENKRYFDYGVSTENGGKYLNESLISQKEGFGARAIVYDTYILKI